MTTVERLKIRCYRCNQLLAVSPTKAGTVVACPKCKADLLIPRQESQARGDGAEETGLAANLSSAMMLSESAAGSPRISAESPSFLDEIAAIIPPELAALRPEDLRVEAEFFGSLTQEPPPPARSAPELSLTDRADPFQFPDSFTPETLIPPAEKPLRSPSAVGFSVASEVVATTAAPIPTPPPLPAPAPDAVIPPIQIEPWSATILPPSTEPRRIHEVTLPASVVVAWSLFVLVAVAMSFVAGLMIGHFLWRTTP
jgi:DNA-directed RNA polymerase subunit RPC12/RpoP